mgnify:CR=1 FL=1
MKPFWKRKVRKTVKGEKIIQIPPEIPIEAQEVFLWVEGDKLVISPRKPEEVEGGV